MKKKIKINFIEFSAAILSQKCLAQSKKGEQKQNYYNMDGNKETSR